MQAFEIADSNASKIMIRSPFFSSEWQFPVPHDTTPAWESWQAERLMAGNYWEISKKRWFSIKFKKINRYSSPANNYGGFSTNPVVFSSETMHGRAKCFPPRTARPISHDGVAPPLLSPQVAYFIYLIFWSISNQIDIWFDIIKNIKNINLIWYFTNIKIFWYFW